MMKNGSGRNRRFKYVVPTLMAGATALGIGSALAGFKAIIHDDTNFLNCNVSQLIQDENGVQVVLEQGETCYEHLTAPQGGIHSLEFVTDAINGPLQATCTLDSIGLNNSGELTIKAESGCLLTGAAAAPEYKCFIDAETNKAFILNVGSYITNDPDNICDETLPASIIAGNVQVTGSSPVEVEFRTQGTIRIFPPFSVASEHVFIANVGQVSGNP
ncbi:hypothetical protein [Thiolapillus sp.]